MGPRNDGRTGLTCPLSPSLTLSIALSPTDAGARAAFQSREKKERRKGNFTPLPLFPPSSFLLPRHRLEKSRSLASSAREHGRHMAEEEEEKGERKRGSGEDGSGRTEEDRGRREGGAQINFLDPLRGGRASKRVGAHQDSLILPFRVRRSEAKTNDGLEGWRKGGREGKGGRGK